MPKHQCKVAHCRQLIDYTDQYCDTHAHIGIKRKQEQAQRYNETTRNNEFNKQYTKFYQSSEWKQARMTKLVNQPLCEECLKNKNVKQGQIVHHIIELKEDWEQRVNQNNLETICRECHNKHHKKKW
ncbi:hypothetical protein BFC20_10920 [Brochothrix thermosphacta]|uniref:HNH endonuclease n=1 Tax=Brochothrix thermosphacta TaxID=2756 RepID=UPI000E72C40C|nr:HNH endonuclease [Brochothrix thermosphacta]ANZ98177.1 hypothetical protein BFC20_10920 [Brochothrix thermosphacta]